MFLIFFNYKEKHIQIHPINEKKHRKRKDNNLFKYSNVRISPVTNLSYQKKKREFVEIFSFSIKKISRISHSGAETAHSDTLDALRINNILLAIAFSSIASTSIGIRLSIFLFHFSIFARRIVDDFPRRGPTRKFPRGKCLRIACTRFTFTHIGRNVFHHFEYIYI